MGESKCKVEVVAFGDQYIRFFDYDCDGFIRGGGSDKIEIESSDGKISPQNVSQFLEKNGLDPWHKYNARTLSHFFSGPLTHFVFRQFSPDMLSSGAILNPSTAFQAIQGWCGADCQFNNVYELIRKQFSKREALAKADLLISALTTKIDEFLNAPEEKQHVMALLISNEGRGDRLKNTLEAAKLLADAFSEKPENLKKVTERVWLHEEKWEAIQKDVHARLVELKNLAVSVDDSLAGFLELRSVDGWGMSGTTIQYSADRFQRIQKNLMTLNASIPSSPELMLRNIDEEKKLGGSFFFKNMTIMPSKGSWKIGELLNVGNFNVTQAESMIALGLGRKFNSVPSLLRIGSNVHLPQNF